MTDPRVIIYLDFDRVGFFVWSTDGNFASLAGLPVGSLRT